MNKPKQPLFHAMPDAERLRLAKRYADSLVDHVAALFTMNAANHLIIYGDTLAKQVPPSYAAHAFNQFRQSMHLFELVRLCALWDSPAKDRESIPTVLALVDKPEIIQEAADRGRALYANELQEVNLSPGATPEQRAAMRAGLDGLRQRLAEEQAADVLARYDEARSQAATVTASAELAALRSFRDRYIAHNLNLAEPDPKQPTEVSGPKYGDENKLLETTVEIADRLHRALNGTAFDWQGSRRIAAENAQALWGACQFVGIAQPPRKPTPAGT